MWPVLSRTLPRGADIEGRYLEPFVGGGATFFLLRPTTAFLSDLNPELIDLYTGVRDSPRDVWQEYVNFPATRRGYYTVRALDPEALAIPQRAARLLFLNRTCFKGMWRHNSAGEFNVGYGGQSRRWVIQERDLCEVSEFLAGADLRCIDFEPVIDASDVSDFVFVDPPYRRGHREQFQDHYAGGRFTFDDQKRLAEALGRASERGVVWAMTNSSHADLLRLYTGLDPAPTIKVLAGGEAIIRNYRVRVRRLAGTKESR